uniref:Uncharacterized protein zf(C3h/c2h2)-1 n=1 Tax=Phallusia mammillata TaxID=59560 RepID=A0A6F9DXI8_9ASCI|nr:uncharacterized protein zf(c3h/c2h2)-1 [Phallusia mammillata]
MSDESDAHRAISALDKYDLCGSKLSVELSTSRSMKSCQLIVKNLPGGINSQDLHKLFKKFGTVTLCRIMGDHAIVHMRFPSMANNAVRNLSGEIFRGNVLSVEFANNNNNKTTNTWKPSAKRDGYQNETTNGISHQDNPPPAPPAPPPPPPRPTQAWKDVAAPSTENSNTVETPAVTTNASTTNTVPKVPTADFRESRRYRIKQGLQFLQSSSPWSGTPDMYESFLNQLKEMLLEEGLELFKEGHPKEAVVQLSEGINICAYMKNENIKGHLNFLEKLLMERATIVLGLGNPSSALEDAEKVLNISNGANQNGLRFKARILVTYGRRNDALALMMKFSQIATFDTESAQLFNILKQSIGDDQSLNNITNKGAIGDGRRSAYASATNLLGQNTFSSPGQSQWPVVNGAGDQTNGFLSGYSHFPSKTSSIVMPNLHSNPSNEVYPPTGSKFQSFFSQDSTNANSNISSAFSTNGIQNSYSKQQPFGPISRPLYPNANFQAPMKSSLFPSDSLFSPAEQISNSFGRDNSLPLPIGYQRSQSLTSAFTSVGDPMWKENSHLFGTQMSNVDNQVDKELAKAIDEELNTGTTTNAAFPSKPAMWHNSNDINSPFAGTNHIAATPSYTHFPVDSSKTGFTGSIIGPAMLGIATTIEQHHQDQQQQAVSTMSAIDTSAQLITISSSYTTNMLDSEMSDSLSEILRNPLHDTHEFKLGCSECVLRTGPRVIDFKHDENVAHCCYKNILLCRHRGSLEWLKIRPRPQPQSKAQLYDGPYYICKDLMAGQDCTYPAVCTFAYNQEEIDVWTLERKGMLNRAWLCKSMDMNYVRNFTLVGLILCKHRGTFDFLCKACFQNKPRIVSTFSNAMGVCMNETTPHQNTPENQQLTHIIRENTVKYTEIRGPVQQPILCRHAIRFQCSRGDDCHFAHSLVERDAWAIMDKESLLASDMVKQAKEHIAKLSASNGDVEGSEWFVDENLQAFRWKAKFICSLCHKNGQISEATKDMKYCTARAQHSWHMNKKVMLVHTTKRSWAQVRDLPYLKNKNLPVRFELCENFRRSKKCSFSSKCNFAHSQEEMDMWMYLRDNQLKDLEELYDVLTKAEQAKLSMKNNANGSDVSSIILPTDIAPQQSAYHCWLCDKECNGQRQWEKHCASEKHKLRAISDSDGHWRYRRPGGNYKMCERHEKGLCEFDALPDSENTCSFAHGREELEEWINRRQYIINRIRKAQDDRLINAEDDVDNLISQAPQS